MPYSFAWTIPSIQGGIATNLTLGGYTVTVTDANGDTRFATAVIEEEAVQLDRAASEILGSCTGVDVGNGSIQMVASGGTPPYTYNFSNSISSTGTYTRLFAGVYTYSIEDVNGCSVMDTISIPTLAATDPICMPGGDTITMDTTMMDTTMMDILPDPISLTIDNLIRVTSDTVTVPVRASLFRNVLSYQHSIQLSDTLQAKIIGVNGMNLEGLSPSNFFQVNDYSLTTAWFDPTVMGITVPDGTVLYLSLIHI